MRKSAVATDVASPLTRAAAALHRPTGTPVQLMRRLVPLDAEHDAAPLTPRAASAARRLVRGAFFLPQDSQQRKKMMIDLEKWLKELKASRSLRIHIKHIKEMHEADAHHQRALAEQEQRKCHERMIRKQRASTERLKAIQKKIRQERLQEALQAAADVRISFRSAVAARPMKHPSQRVYMVGRRAAGMCEM